MNERRTKHRMRLLFVHQHLGAQGGAEANIVLTSKELERRGHTTALLHVSRTGRGEQSWLETFSKTFQLKGRDKQVAIDRVLQEFEPDIIYLHNLADLELME